MHVTGTFKSCINFEAKTFHQNINFNCFINFFCFFLLLSSGQYDKRWRDGDSLQQSQSSSVSVRQHLCHHGPRRNQTADRDAAGHPEPAGSRQPQQPAQAGRAVPTARWTHTHTRTRVVSWHSWFKNNLDSCLFCACFRGQMWVTEPSVHPVGRSGRWFCLSLTEKCQISCSVCP